MEDLKSHADLSKMSAINGSILNNSEESEIQIENKRSRMRVKSLVDMRTEEEKQQGFDSFLELARKTQHKMQAADNMVKKKRVSIFASNDRANSFMPTVNEHEEDIGDDDQTPKLKPNQHKQMPLNPSE